MAYQPHEDEDWKEMEDKPDKPLDSLDPVATVAELISPGSHVAIPPAKGESDDISGLPLMIPAQRGGPISPWRPAGTVGRRFASSLDLLDHKNRIVAFRAISGEDFKAEDVLGEWFQVKDWLTVDASKLDPLTGVVQNFVRTVLICEDGTRISCGSDWVISSLMALEGMLGKAPWSPSMRLCIKAGRSGSKRTFYTLDVS